MKRYIQILLFVFDATGYIQAAIQFFYYKNYALGTIMTLICALLNIYLYMSNKKNKVLSFIKDNFAFLKELDGSCRLFKWFCIIYDCLDVIIFLLSTVNSDFKMMIIYWVLLPLLFSIFTYIFHLVNKNNTDKITKLYNIALLIPSLFVLIGGILSIGRLFDIILIIFLTLIVYLPSFFISMFTSIYMN